MTTATTEHYYAGQFCQCGDPFCELAEEAPDIGSFINGTDLLAKTSPDVAPEPRKDPEPIQVPEEASKPAEKTSGPSETGAGLQFAKRWVIALAGSTMKPMEALLGSVIREHVHVATGEVYVGSDRIAELTGWDERHVRRRRTALVKAGWLVDTGKAKGRAKVFRLAIPGQD